MLLIALARAELNIDDEQAALWYETQRERHWSSFLNDAYRALQQTMAPVDEETAENDAAETPAAPEAELDEAA